MYKNIARIYLVLPQKIYIYKINNKYDVKIQIILPKIWRYWRIFSVQDSLAHISWRNIWTTLFYFIDHTLDIIEWGEYIQSYLLAKFRDTCNKNLIPNVLIPWYFSDYNHKYVNLRFIINLDTAFINLQIYNFEILIYRCGYIP